MFKVSRDRAVNSGGMAHAQPVVASGGPWGGSAAPTEYARRNRYRCPGHLRIAGDDRIERTDDKIPELHRATPTPSLLN